MDVELDDGHVYSDHTLIGTQTGKDIDPPITGEEVELCALMSSDGLMHYSLNYNGKHITTGLVRYWATSDSFMFVRKCSPTCFACKGQEFEFPHLDQFKARVPYGFAGFLFVPDPYRICVFDDHLATIRRRPGDNHGRIRIKVVTVRSRGRYENYPSMVLP